MSGGEQLRDYLHVGEVARYLVNLALKQKDLGLVGKEHWNKQKAILKPSVYQEKLW